jgi:hypothetical protein
MEVKGMPTFSEGQRSVLFVSQESGTVSPLVGFWYGRLRIEKDRFGVDRMRTHDGRALGSTAELGANRANYMLSITPMRLRDLATAVRNSAVARQ